MVGEIRDLLDAYGSITFASAYARGIADAALDAFETAFSAATAGPDLDFVRALVPYMLDRRA
jgi:geranylgeranyl diphosphate synthase type II